MVSVIVPVYNVENVLHYCIDSILDQTYTNFELILVDDGSSDDSGVQCDQYAEKNNRIKVIHQENGGVSSARNAGIDAAQGEYICFIDSDDYIEQNYLEKLILCKEEHPESDNIWCGFRTVDNYEDPNVLQKVVYSDRESKSIVSKKIIMDLHEKWLDAGPVCKMYSRKIIIDNAIWFNESISLGEDLVFNYNYIDKTNGIIIAINDSLYNYVQIRNESLSTKYYPNLFDIYKHNNNIMQNYIASWDCDAKQKQIFYNSCFYLYERVLANTYHKDSDCKHRIRYNTKILKSKEFTSALNKSDCFIHPLYRFAYQHHSYMMVRVLDVILKLIKAKKK